MLMNGDSITTDSSVVYEIPEIIQMGSESDLDKIFSHRQTIDPEDYDIALSNTLFRTPFMTISYGNGQLQLLSQRGQDPSHTDISINNHRIDDPLFGAINLTSLPVQFIEKVCVDQDFFSTVSIDLKTKVNHYDKPFSSIRFMTGEFGADLYNIDFTRPITNEFGFYLSGLHWDAQGHRQNAQFQINSLYTNLYYNQIIPTRLDFIYFSNEHGTTEETTSIHNNTVKDRFIDIAVAGGTYHHKFAFYHTRMSSHYHDSLSNLLYEDVVRNYGIEFENYLVFQGYEISYDLGGVVHVIDIDPYSDPALSRISHTENSLQFWTSVNRSFHRTIFSLLNRCELKDSRDFFYVPRLAMGIVLFDSTLLTATLARNYRTPLFSETHFSDTIPHPSLSIRGNGDLLPEYYWVQECGIKRENSAVTFYKYDYDNPIVMQLDTNVHYTYQNIDTWQTIGLEGSFELPIHLDTRHNESLTDFSIGFSGNYLFKGDSLPFIPEAHAGIFLSLKRNTERFGLEITTRIQRVGARQDVQGNTLDPFTVISLIGSVRFITLSLMLHLDNISNENYAYVHPYTLEPRHLNFSLRWDFWD